MVYLQRWHGRCHMKLLPYRCVLCTPYNHAPCHFMQSHIRKVYACLAVTCHLHFWQNDWGLLRATAVTRGWSGYRNKSQHRKLTLEKKILPLLTRSMESANRTRQVVDTISMTGEADFLHNYIIVISDQSTNNTCKVIPSCFCHCKEP